LGIYIYMVGSVKIGFFGSCQLILCCNFFLNEQVKKKYNINIVFCLPFFEYDPDYLDYRGKLDYSIFDNLDILILEKNSLNNQASSEKIINYLNNKNVKIIKTFILKFPIYPINWNGMGENKQDYVNWDGLDNINYIEKFKKCIDSIRRDNIESDLSTDITDFIENNYNKHLLFTHSLHPTNLLLYQLWKYILQNLSINIEENEYIFTNELIDFWYNPFTTKMIKDLDIQFKNVVIDDQFYINRYNEFKSYFL